MSVPANKALGAHEEVKKDLVDILKMYMPANLNQIPAYMQPKRLYTVQSTVVHTKHKKALAAPKAVKVERCQRQLLTRKDYSCPCIFVVVQLGPTSRVVGTLPLVNWISCPDTAKSTF